MSTKSELAALTLQAIDLMSESVALTTGDAEAWQTEDPRIIRANRLRELLTDIRDRLAKRSEADAASPVLIAMKSLTGETAALVRDLATMFDHLQRPAPRDLTPEQWERHRHGLTKTFGNVLHQMERFRLMLNETINEIERA